MSLRTDLLDAVLDKRVGKQGIVSAQQVVDHFPQYSEAYKMVFLASSVMAKRQRTPTRSKFTTRVERGMYHIDNRSLIARKNERKLESKAKKR